MKHKRLFTFCLAAILAGCSAFSVSASADSVPDFRSVYEVSDKVYALWEECGISISDVQKMMSQTRTSGIKDYGTRIKCLYADSTPESFSSTLQYKPGDLSVFDIVTSGSITSTSDSWINPSTLNRTSDISFSNTGVVLKYRYSVATPGTNISSVVIQHAFSNTGNSSYMCNFNIPLGDVNDDGDVDIVDYIAVSNFVVEAPTGSPFFTERADVNMDGYINPTDMSLINQYVAKLIPHIWGNS